MPKVRNEYKLVDSSCGKRITFREYADLVEDLARGLIAAGLQPGEVIAIFLPNSWVLRCLSCGDAREGNSHATESDLPRAEVRHQLTNSGAAFLITDGPNIDGVSLANLPNLRRAFIARGNREAARKCFPLCCGP